MGQTNYDFTYLLVSVGAALFAVGAVVAAFDGLYSTVVENVAASIILAYLSYRLSRNRRKSSVHSLNI